jgi:hypothetical protein
MARTEAMLTSVGARRTTSAGLSGDAFEVALFEFVCDIDLTAGVAEIDATPIPHATLRAQATPPQRRRPSWRLLVPALTSGVAAVAIGLILLVAGSSPVKEPALTATAESQQLLTHADMLLTAAQSAAATERTKLVTEAKADLTHVTRLLPLAPPAARPEIRAQLQDLNQRMAPLSPTQRPRPTANDGDGARSGQVAPQRTGGGATTTDSSSDAGATTPDRQQPPLRRPPGDNTTTTQSTTGGPRPPATGDTSAGTTTTSGTGPAPQPRPTSGSVAPPPDGSTYSGTYQQPPRAPQPRP